jgi:hypothetical protein
MKKYGPFILILASVILIIYNIIEKNSFKYIISSSLLIIAMVIINYKTKNKEKKSSD